MITVIFLSRCFYIDEKLADDTVVCERKYESADGDDE